MGSIKCRAVNPAVKYEGVVDGIEEDSMKWSSSNQQ